jgi:putative N6-adenine-specific DNA methylase
MADPTPLNLFAVCLPGLEPLVEDELRGLGVFDPIPGAGGVAFVGDMETVYQVNVGAGLIGHVLIRIAEFGARSLQDLDVRGARVDWSQWLPEGTPFVVKASCRKSRIYHSGAAEQRIEKHVSGHVGVTEGDHEPVVIRVRLQDNRCTISLDSSGAPLHRRGWRLEPGRAPLREDLARALVIASGWDRLSPLLDPMAGSGTILVEAAALARGLAPGRMRNFACEQFAGHDAPGLARVKSGAARDAKPDLPFRIFGSDRDTAAIKTTEANAERAGVLGDIDIRQAPLNTAHEVLPDPPPYGALVTNPPYGKRLDDPATLVDLYRAIGDLRRRLPPTWRLAIAASDRRLALRSGLPLESAFLADSGGLKIRALRTPA